MTNHTFTVAVTADTPEQAAQVMTERLGCDEDYGFPYSVDWESPDPVVVVCVRHPDASNEYKFYGAPHPVVFDIDLGSSFDGYPHHGDTEAALEWADGNLSALDGLPDDHPARAYVTGIVLDTIAYADLTLADVQEYQKKEVGV